jgi:hypothetical protein
VRAIAREVSVPFALLTRFMVLLGAMFLPICEVVEASIEYGLWDIQGRRGIMEDAWLEAAEGVDMDEGMQGIVLLLSCIVV